MYAQVAGVRELQPALKRNKNRTTSVLCSTKAMGSIDVDSGIARAFPGGWVAHPEDQDEEEN